MQYGFDLTNGAAVITPEIMRDFLDLGFRRLIGGRESNRVGHISVATCREINQCTF